MPVGACGPQLVGALGAAPLYPPITGIDGIIGINGIPGIIGIPGIDGMVGMVGIDGIAASLGPAASLRTSATAAPRPYFLQAKKPAPAAPNKITMSMVFMRILRPR